MAALRNLSPEEITALEQAGCCAENWKNVQVAQDFATKNVKNVQFLGNVSIGSLTGSVQGLPAGLFQATISNCQIGNGVRIAGVNGVLANYKIEDGALLSNLGKMTTEAGATFGHGIELETINEGGGRDVKIFSELSSQFAYIFGMHRYRPTLIEKMDQMIEKEVAAAKSDMGCVGKNATVENVKEIKDVNIGPCAKVSGAARLVDGTILSEEAAPTFVGIDVIADGFIMAEGAKVDSGAVLGKCFIGQNCKVGRQFSGENSLFFANCECFHSEACSVFGGPYTVTHHRSTLLIAGVFSFFNAGSGTNQSNHMYKLGPLHQGMVERGAKTGSFSYMLWPCVISPFSVVIGKNMANFDISEFPFSYVTAEHEGTFLTPAMNMYTVGTTRDGEKWPKRDGRKATKKRDLIRFEVFSPYVVGRMLQGEATLGKLGKETDRSVETIRYKGIAIKRLMLRSGAKEYRKGVDMYLGDKIQEKAASAQGIDAIRKAFAIEADAVYSADWADVSGLLMGKERLVQFENDVEAGKIASVADFQAALEAICAAYEKDEWAWVRTTWEARTGKSLDDVSLEDLEKLKTETNKLKASFAFKVLGDAEKEFDDVSKIGFGYDGNDEDRDKDFEVIRGNYEGNSFIKQMRARQADAKANK